MVVNLSIPILSVSILLSYVLDIIISIFDTSRELNEEDLEILEMIKDKNSIIVLNKMDLESKIDLEKIKEVNKPIVEMSIKNGEGKDKLFSEISKMFKLDEIANDGEVIVSNQRHKYLIKNARKNVEQSREAIKSNMPIDIISTSIRQILEDLGEITGETVTEDIISEIFSKFCLGK